MTVTAIWCRHENDNIIGIGGVIPWRVESDIQRFREIVAGQAVVVGRKTYESLPNRTIENCRMYVLSSDAAYEVSNPQCHQVVTSQKVLADVEEDLYIAGGAEIYHLFLTGKEKLKPQIIVDCIYQGEVRDVAGLQTDIAESVNEMEKKYRRISPFYCKDEVSAALWIRKGEFVEQSVLKRLVSIIEKYAVVHK